MSIGFKIIIIIIFLDKIIIIYNIYLMKLLVYV